MRVVGCPRDISWCRGRDASTADGGEGGSYPWCCRSLLVSWAADGTCVSVVAVAGRRRDPLVLRIGRRQWAKEEGLELELGGCSGVAWRSHLLK